jgi:hypothetical protein
MGEVPSALIVLILIPGGAALAYNFGGSCGQRAPPKNRLETFITLFAWFLDEPIYAVPQRDLSSASYVILWPFLGWLEITPARWLWAVTGADARMAGVFGRA